MSLVASSPLLAAPLVQEAAFVPHMTGSVSHDGPRNPPQCTAGGATRYADSLRGKRTASGERYDPRALTAAHRTLPLGTMVRVIWHEREIIVRINDRGPYNRRAVVDLSRAAASALGLDAVGYGHVRVCAVNI